MAKKTFAKNEMKEFFHFVDFSSITEEEMQYGIDRSIFDSFKHQRDYYYLTDFGCFNLPKNRRFTVNKFPEFVFLYSGERGYFYALRESAYRRGLEEFFEKKKMKKRAEELGIAYWPALATKSLDPRAIKRAEEILSVKHGYYGKDRTGTLNRGGWDMEGGTGISPNQLLLLWWKGGCRLSGKFDYMVKNNHLIKNTVGYHGIRKSHTVSDIRRLIIGWRWTQKHFPETQFKDKTLMFLGRLSKPLRWAVCSSIEVDNPQKIKVSDLNLAAAKSVQDKKVSRDFFVPMAHRARRDWGKLFPMKETHLIHGRLGEPDIRSLKISPLVLVKNVDIVRKNSEESFFALNWWQPGFVLTRLFGKDVASMEKYVRDHHGGNWHDAGQLQLPESYFSPIWGKLILSASTLKKNSRFFAKAEEYLGRPPKNVTEAKGALEIVVPKNTSFLDSLSPGERGEYEELIGYEKSFITIPAPGGSGGIKDSGYRLFQMDHDDLRVPGIGTLTDCCQHLTGAAASAARASYTHSDFAVWAVEKGDTIVAQSLIWRSGDTLVLDSVEALTGHRNNTVIFDLFLKGIKTIEEKLGVNRVLVSTTKYGATREFVDHLRLVEKSATPKLPLSVYTDTGSECFVIIKPDYYKNIHKYLVVVRESQIQEETGVGNNLSPETDTGVYCEHCDSPVHHNATTCWHCGGIIEEWVD